MNDNAPRKPDPLVPRFNLDQLREIGERHELANGVPISGIVALGIIRDETLAHLYVAMDRIPPVLKLLDTVIAVLKAGGRRRTVTQQSLDQGAREDSAEAKGTIQATDWTDAESLRKLLAKLKALRLNTIERLEDIDAERMTTEDELTVISAALQAIKELQRSFKPLGFKGVAAYLTGFATGRVLTAFAIVLELVIAYVVSRWIEPLVEGYASFAATVVVLFLLGYFILSPIAAYLVESLLWLIYWHRYLALRRAMEDLDGALLAVQAAAGRFRPPTS